MYTSFGTNVTTSWSVGLRVRPRDLLNRCFCECQVQSVVIGSFIHAMAPLYVGGHGFWLSVRTGRSCGRLALFILPLTCSEIGLMCRKFWQLRRDALRMAPTSAETRWGVS